MSKSYKGKSICHMTREEEIDSLAKNQLSHDVDLPAPKQERWKDSEWVYVEEVPVNPAVLDSVLPANALITPEPRLRPELRVYVKGRDWTIQSYRR
jgi:hypothetical protein